jgi:O-antigen/teichoic acid export membrane protein
MVIILGILLWGNVTDETFKIEWFVYAQTASYALTFLITLIAVLRKSGYIQIKFDRIFFIAFFKQSYPYALLILLMAFYNRFDSVMIDAILPDQISPDVPEELTGHFQAGVYAQAYRILDGASQFGYLFAGLLLPIFARMIKKRENIGSMVQLSFSLIIVPAIVIAITSSVFSEELMNTLYHGGTAYSAPIFSIIILGFISISTTYIFGTLLTANGSLKHLNIMAAIGISANLIINLSLIPHFMALGAAYSSFITQSITAVAQVIIAWKIFNLKFNYFFIFKVILLILTAYFAATFFQDFFQNFWYAIAASISTSILIALVIKLLNIKDLFLIIKDSQME